MFYHLLSVRSLVVGLQDEILYGRIPAHKIQAGVFVDGLRANLNVGPADVGVVDCGLECAIWPRFRDQGAYEALVRKTLL